MHAATHSIKHMMQAGLARTCPCSLLTVLMCAPNPRRHDDHAHA